MNVGASIASSIQIRNAGMKPDSLHTELESKIDMSPLFGASLGGQHGVYDIRIKLFIKADASQERLEELVQKGLQQSPAYNSMKNPVRVIVIKE